MGTKAKTQGKATAQERRSGNSTATVTGAVSFLKKAWHFLWYEDSVLSWVANIVVAFVLIKFILYPGLGLLLGTNFPVVAVVSSSMEHHPHNFDEWWTAKNRGSAATNEDFYLSRNITRYEFEDYPFQNGFNKGDIMVLRGVDPAKLERGEVMVYWSGMPYPIIHRYIGSNVVGPQRFLVSKGDNNPGSATCQSQESCRLDELRIKPDQVLGTAVLRIPYLGWVKIFAVNLYVCTFQGTAPGQGYGACLIDGQRLSFA